jgi:aminoglycoside phosphotransferase (APT) family kinase protein
MHARVAAFIARRWSVPESLIQCEVQPLQGGLESSVARARITPPESHSAVPSRLVIKELRAGFEREADIYELLWRHIKQPPAVHVLGRDTAGHATYLYLEDAQSISSWPWSDSDLTAAACREIARLHDSRTLPRESFSWDYEPELARSAEATVEVANRARGPSGRRHWRRLGDLRRVAAALPAIRLRLLSGATTVIHGDVHPGNVILRRGDTGIEVVLVDWARARIGSPLEDVASWLHSLGCWEPQARRRHDTLMRAYLHARAVARPFASDVRVEYWLASVSNGLAGAIRYHLAVLSDPTTSESARYDSRRALTAWERVVRRASPLVSTNLNRCT